MRKLKWQVVLIGIFISILPCLASEANESWRVLSLAWIAFENNSPGEALHLCEKSRQIHRDSNEFMQNEIGRASCRERV